MTLFNPLFSDSNANDTAGPIVPDPSGNPYVGDATQDGLVQSSAGLVLTIQPFKISSNGFNYTVPLFEATLLNEKYYQFLYSLKTRTWLFDPKDSEGEMLFDPDRVLIGFAYTYNNSVYYFYRKILSSIAVRQAKRRQFAYSLTDWKKDFAITDSPYAAMFKDAQGGGFTGYFQNTALYLLGKVPDALQMIKNALLATLNFCTASYYRSLGTYTAGQHMISYGWIWRCAVGGQVSVDAPFTGTYTLGSTVTDGAATWVAIATAPMAIATKRSYHYELGTAVYQKILWQCTTAGTTASSAPSYAGHVVTDTVTDGTAVFTAVRADYAPQGLTAESRNWYFVDFNGYAAANRSFTYKTVDKTVQNGWVWTCTVAGTSAESSPFSGTYMQGDTVTDGTVTWRADIDLTMLLNPWGWRREDSNDSYPALFIYALYEYVRLTGDVSILAAATLLPKVATGYYTVQEALIELNYDNILNNIGPAYALTNTFKMNVTPESDVYQIGFCGDTCEVANAEVKLAELYRLRYALDSNAASDPTAQAGILAFATGFANAIGGLYDDDVGNYAWYGGADNAAMQPGLSYPDCFAQRMVSEHSIALPFDFKLKAMKWQNCGNWQMHQRNLSSELATVALLAKNGQISRQMVDESVDAWIDLYAMETPRKGSALDYAAYLSLTAG